MSKNYNFYFCGINENCALCNGCSCPGCGKCPILVGEAEEKLAETGDARILLFNTKNADMIGGEEFDAIKESLPEEMQDPIWVFDFGSDFEPSEEEIRREELVEKIKMQELKEYEEEQKAIYNDMVSSCFSEDFRGDWENDDQEDEKFKKMIIKYVDNPTNTPEDVMSKEEIYKEWKELHPTYLAIFYHKGENDYSVIDIDNNNFMEFYDNCRMNIHSVVEIKDGIIINPFTGEILYINPDESDEEDEEDYLPF